MLAFQETELYRAVLDLNVLARELEPDDYIDDGYYVDSLQQRTLSMVVDLARAQGSEAAERSGFLDEVRVSACVCAALFDLCGNRLLGDQPRSREVLAKIVQLIDGERATSPRGRR